MRQPDPEGRKEYTSINTNKDTVYISVLKSSSTKVVNENIRERRMGGEACISTRKTIGESQMTLLRNGESCSLSFVSWEYKSELGGLIVVFLSPLKLNE